MPTTFQWQYPQVGLGECRALLREFAGEKDVEHVFKRRMADLSSPLDLTTVLEGHYKGQTQKSLVTVQKVDRTKINIEKPKAAVPVAGNSTPQCHTSHRLEH